MTLKLNGLEVDCVIGERADERMRPQRLLVDAELDVADLAAETDALADAVDYAALADRIRAALVAAKCRLVERAARVVAETCLAEPNAYGVKVAVTKADAVPGLASATVVLEAEAER